MPDQIQKKKFTSYDLSHYDVQIENPSFECRVFWARVVSSENESLFTQYTKHTFYEIQYALEGHIGMAVKVGDRVDVPESGFVVIPPDTYHQVVDADSEGARFIMAFRIEIKDPRLAAAARNLNRLIPRHETPYMRPLLSMLLDKNRDRGALCSSSLSTLLEAFLLEILEALTDEKDKKRTPLPPAQDAQGAAEEMMEFIKSRNGIGIRVSDVAKHFSVSERHLGRIFLQNFGVSPKETINHEKLRRIEEYIVSTELSLYEIAELCGFCDEYAMNKFFRRYNATRLSDFQRLVKKRKG